MSILIKNGTIVTLGAENRVLKNHALYIENNQIKKILPDSHANDLNPAKIIDAKGKLVMPGFINAHMHYYSSFARGLGKAAPSKNFPEILKNLWWRLDQKLTLEDCYYSAMVANIQAIRFGTTTLIDHHASPNAALGSLDKIAAAVLDSGLRASLCYELSDRDGAEISENGLEENMNFIKQYKDGSNDQLRALFGMHASFTIDDKTLESACKLANDLGIGIHIHCAEDISDQELTRKKYGEKVVKRLYKMGALKPDTILAHCVHIDSEEIDLIKKTKTIVVHNPQSNMNNSVGVANIFRLLDEGILVGLGTDAMTTNMLEELRSSMWIHKLMQKDPSAGFMEVTGLLIHGNREIANRYWKNMGVGELKEGGVADVILVDYHSPTPLDEGSFLGHLVFGISQSQVDTTIASGKLLMENKKLSHIDEEQVMARALELSSQLWQRF